MSFLRLAFDKLQYVSLYVVIYTNIADKHSIVAFLLCFSVAVVAVATHISLASLMTCLTRPHSLRDVGPLRAGSTIARVIRECHCNWAVLSKLRFYLLLSKNGHLGC
jgi:hypothetical protein